MNDINTEDLLDMTLDDLEDLPTYEPYPAGAHRVLITLEERTVNDNKCVEALFKLVETEELAEPLKDGVKAPVAGAETSLLCMLDNEWGRGTLKLLASPIGQHLGIANIREVVSQTTDLEVMIVTYLSFDKKNNIDRMKVKELIVI